MKKKNRIMIYPLVVMGVLLLLGCSCKKGDNNNNPTTSGAITDVDGNVYHSVTIGTQVWMVENLKTTKYRNGNLIPNVTDKTAWGNLISGAYCNYDNIATNSTTYGRLYNWYAVNDSRNIAPKGWHIPSFSEWKTLINYLGGDAIAGSKLKETGTAHWWSPNTATNESGFTALPAGYRIPNFDFVDLGEDATTFWSTSEFNSLEAYSQTIYYAIYQGKSVEMFEDEKWYGYSVRCIKD